ncbi:F-box/WD repeat-containing protein 4 [Armigeres subalbatus]|uniref:F-box/WD repeat-containing protein 4 n=1 Tax=Armigeres subalbatus TaxID=124917 RepID=UPI002ED65550
MYNEAQELNICDLNEHVLEHIFHYLPLRDLDRAVQVCKKFYTTINSYIFARQSATLLLTGHQQNSQINRSVSRSDRNLNDFSYRKRIHLFDNWRYGRYCESHMFNHRMIYFSHIVLEKRWLYMTHRGQLRAHERVKKDYMLKNRASWTIGKEKDPDISWIAKKRQILFGGRTDGTCFVQDHSHHCYSRQRLEDDVITSVDFEGDVYICSTKSKCTSFWRGSINYGDCELELMRRLDEPYQTIKLSPDDGSKLAVGKYHDRSNGALRIIDVERGTTSRLESPTKAVYQLLWRDYNTILTGNFDTTMRMVDIRTSSDAAVWTDPYDASVYCLDYDGAYAVLCGMKYHFRVNLYDLRVPKRCIQMYFPSNKFSQYSPVHSVAADSSQLFIITDNNLRILNFDVHGKETKDYTWDLNKWLY